MMKKADLDTLVRALGNLATTPDPTANVIAILETAVKRQDDLRSAESVHLHELMKAEGARLDAIRSVDMGAVAAAAAVATTQAQTLANQVAASAEAMRTTLAATLEPIQKDIQDLRRAQYEAQGSKTQVVETRAAGSFSWQTAGVVIAALVLIATVIIAITR